MLVNMPQRYKAIDFLSPISARASCDNCLFEVFTAPFLNTPIIIPQISRIQTSSS